MGIQNFPAALQPIIQQGFLAREFEAPLKSKLGYRMIADRMTFPNGSGETVTKTRVGLKKSITTPSAPSTNTNLDNGITPTGWGVEQFTLGINQYDDAIDLNMVTSRVGIVGQFLTNAMVNGEQAGRSLDDLARNALFAPYMGGATRVITTLGSAGPAVVVDDIRGFQYGYVNGVQTAVSSSNPITATVNGNTYYVIAAAASGTSTAIVTGGIAGTLTFSGNVAVADATAGNTVLSSTGSVIKRPNGRTNTSGLQATDTINMGTFLDAVALLRSNAVPTVGGVYNCYLDPTSGRELFADPDFKQLFQGASSSSAVFKNGVVSDFLGLRFITTTEAYQQAHPSLSGVTIHRPIVCGQGAIIEGDFEGMGHSDVVGDDALVEMVDGVCMVTREPLDRLKQIISQAWYWIGGFCAPSDTTTNSTTVPTASNANYKRAVIIEHV